MARTRLRARRDSKAVGSSERSLPFLAKPVAVIGQNADALRLIEQVLTEFAGFDVDRLDPSPRSLAYLTHREYDCIVIDAARTDPVGYTSDLIRRLVAVRARGVPVVVCRTPGTSGPSLEALVQRTQALVVERPFDVPTIIEAIATATDAWSPDAGPELRGATESIVA